MRLRLSALVFAGLLGFVALGLAAPAGAVDNPAYTSPPPSTVVTTTSMGTTPQAVKTVVNVRPIRSRLAITGSDVGQTAAVGAVLLLSGVGVMVLRRRPSAA